MQTKQKARILNTAATFMKTSGSLKLNVNKNNNQQIYSLYL